MGFPVFTIVIKFYAGNDGESVWLFVLPPPPQPEQGSVPERRRLAAHESDAERKEGIKTIQLFVQIWTKWLCFLLSWSSIGS